MKKLLLLLCILALVSCSTFAQKAKEKPKPKSNITANISTKASTAFGSYVPGWTGNSCTAISCATSSTSTGAGDLIFMGIFLASNIAPVSMQDTQGNVWKQLVPGTLWGNPKNFLELLYYTNNIKGGADTVTLTVASSVYMELHPVEYSGVDISATPFDGVAPALIGSGLTATTAPVTTTTANDLLFGYVHGCCGGTTGGSQSAGTGWTARPTASSNGEDKIAATPGTYTATMNFTPSNYWVGFLVAVKPASTAPIHTVSLVWTMPTTCVPPGTPCPAPTQSTVYRGASSGGEGSIPYAIVPAPTAAYIDNNVTNGMTYYYQVTVTNSAGESGKSAEVMAPIPATPTGCVPVIPTGFAGVIH